MPYIPPHLRPGYVAKVVVPVEIRRKVHFPTNALHATDMTTNVTVPDRRYSPVSNTRSIKPILKKNTGGISPNKEPVAMPTHNVHKLPPKFRDMLLRRIPTTRKRGKSRKRGNKTKQKKHQ